MIEAGATFAGYRLGQLIATDTVSSIYRATPLHGPATRPVALRITRELRTDDGADAGAIARYIRDLSAALRVNHPALATGVDAGEIGDRVWVATALVATVPLGQWLRDHGRLAVDDAVMLLRDIAEGLDRAHAAGVVHGAISSRTIGVRAGGPNGPGGVLRGFGLASLLARQAAADREAIDLRDIEYVAPEQLRGDVPDGRADQYALACALYHCVTGTPPYIRDSATGLFGAHLFSPVPTGGDDRAVAGALTAGMSKRPDGRHASCADLLRAIAPAAATRRRPGRDARAAAWRDDAPAADAGPAPSAGRSGRRRRGDGRRGLRLGGERWPRVRWPIAAMVVLSGMISTLGLATLARGGHLLDGGGVLSDGAEVAGSSLATSGDGPVDAGVRWQRPLTDEAVYHVEVVDGTVVAAAPHGVFALGSEGGVTAWSSPVDVGVLTDLAVTDSIVALRAATFRAVGIDDGVMRWQNGDIVAPISSLVAADDTIYGIGPGRLEPELVAIDPETGAQRWHYGGGSAGISGDAAVAAAADIVAVADEAGLTVIDPAGSIVTADDGRAMMRSARWMVDVDRPWISTLAVLPDAVVLATRTGQVCAYDPADGTQRWCVDVDGLTDESPVLTAERDVVVVVRGQRVTALALETGTQQWNFEAERPLTPVVASDGGQVVVADAGGGAHGLDLVRGYETWRASGLGDVTALAADDAAVYIATRGGRLIHVRATTRDVAS
jgi:outer membrane protein assembly factor BamB